MIKKPHNIATAVKMRRIEGVPLQEVRHFDGNANSFSSRNDPRCRCSPMACAFTKGGYIISHQNRRAAGGACRWAVAGSAILMPRGE
jgi:hypothetical protein